MAGLDNNTVLLLDGQAFKDISNNPKTIVNNGVTITDGKFDNSFYLNGTSNYLQISNIDFQNILSNDFTFEFYINITSYNQTYPTPFSIVSGESTAGRSLYIHTTPDVTAFTFGNGSNSPCIISTDALNVGEWYHMAMVRKGNTFKAFLNGSLVEEMDIDNFYVPSETNFYFGNLTPSNSSSYFNGKIDEVRVSNIARYNYNFTPPSKFTKDIEVSIVNENISINVLSEKIDTLDILINDVLYKTYKNVFSSFDCAIDKTLLCIGDNEITIKTTINEIYNIEIVKYTFDMDKLISTSSLKDVIDAQSICNNTIENCRIDLKNKLIEKGIDVKETNNIRSLISKLDEINIGKKWASGSIAEGSTSIQITNLEFTPSFVILMYNNIQLGQGNNNRCYVYTPSYNYSGYRKNSSYYSGFSNSHINIIENGFTSSSLDVAKYNVWYVFE